MKADPHLHIVAFDIPYPPDYGGAIEVYYRIEALAQLGVKIHLHAFQYGREQATQLNEICHTVQYYPRRSVWESPPFTRPYIVSSRAHPQLLRDLLQDDYPILFEGLHTCAYLAHPSLAKRIKAVRLHNIEWEYYKGLAQSEKKHLRRLYYTLESYLLRRYEPILQHADAIFAISPSDHAYYQQHFDYTYHLPAFHPNQSIECRMGKGTYALYHGNLSVSENHQAAMFLVNEVFAHLTHPLYIAGKQPRPELIQTAANFPNIRIIADPETPTIRELIRDAHINILPTFQATGVKLKLLNALFRGRFCIVNPMMIESTGLEDMCYVAETSEEFQEITNYLFLQTFTPQLAKIREQILLEEFSNQAHAQFLLKVLDS